MRLITCTATLALFFCLLGTSTVHAQQKGSITCKVFDFENADGNLFLTLYNQEEGFPEDLETAVETKIVKMRNSEVMVVEFKDLPLGQYAIAGHHDENQNGEMDYNWIGMPKEGYCFSKDAKPVLSAPSFNATKFSLDKEQMVIYIHMQN